MFSCTYVDITQKCERILFGYIRQSTRQDKYDDDVSDAPRRPGKQIECKRKIELDPTSEETE